MTIGKLYAILAILFGGFLSSFGYHMVQTEGSVLKILLIGPVMFCFGTALLFFSGYPVTLTQSRNKEVAPDAFYKQAPKLHKIVWAVAAGIGFIIAMIFLKF